MENKKPYVWVNLDGPGNPVLEIRINKTIELVDEYEDSDFPERLIAEFKITGDASSDYMLPHQLTEYLSSHRKVTVKITEGGTLRGMCTVMPTTTFFF